MVDTKAMGFTNGWEQEPLWRKSSNERGCVIIDYGHLWCTLLLYIV